MNSMIAGYFGVSIGGFAGAALLAGVTVGILPPHGGLIALPVAIGTAAGIYQYRKNEREDAAWVKSIGERMGVIVAHEIHKKLED